MIKEKERENRGKDKKVFKKRPGFFRRKVCIFCKEKTTEIDYKDSDKLRRYINERGKISSTRSSGNCAKHQRMLAKAVKISRFISLLPYAAE